MMSHTDNAAPIRLPLSSFSPLQQMDFLDRLIIGQSSGLKSARLSAVRWSKLAKPILAFVLPSESVSYQEIQSIHGEIKVQGWQFSIAQKSMHA